MLYNINLMRNTPEPFLCAYIKYTFQSTISPTLLDINALYVDSQPTMWLLGLGLFYDITL